MIPGFSVLPWLPLGTAVAAVVGVIVSGPLGRWLGVRRTVAGALVLGLGMILAGTLTPKRSAIEDGTVGSATCDFSRIWLASPADLIAFYDAGLNVVLFLPVGFAIALAPRSRRKAAVVIALTALPFAIEATQLLMPRLDRACESADVVDNLTGLAVGLAGGTVVARLFPGVRRPQE